MRVRQSSCAHVPKRLNFELMIMAPLPVEPFRALFLCLMVSSVVRTDTNTWKNSPTAVGETKAPLESAERRSVRESVSVLIVSSFYSGHIIPLVAVGEELVTRGHNVSFLTTEVAGSRLIPALPREAGMTFISAGPDPRTKSEYEEVIYGLMGKSPLQQTGDILMLARDNTLPLRIACDRLNISKWDIILVDVISVNLVRYLDMRWQVKIVLSIAIAADFISSDSPWPSPSVQCINCEEDMSFFQRLVTAVIYKNSLVRFFTTKWMKSYLAGNDSTVWGLVSDDPLENFLPDELHPSLMYTAVGVEYARPSYPGVHMVGPVLRRNVPPLQGDLQKWLAEKGKETVVYISMGTTALVTEKMADSFVRGILATNYSVVWSLRESNQNVLRDLEIDTTRFFITSWVSQVAVLRHAAVGLSILHCGTGGIHEALYFKVPIICIPFWFDQFSWANRIRDQGLGEVLYAEDISPEKITNSIHRLGHPRIKQKVAMVSKILEEAGGSQRAADLVEFYAEVGYDHLVPSYVKYKWNFVKIYNLDVYLVLLSIACICVLIVWTLCMYIAKYSCCKCRGKSKKD